ncbi:hypothetical protein ACFQDE_13950 [Deinococcus caeni]|uniref:hypothetical protein n=1 Tax=Deinococcus caeni TaxID=569127 RepID=UPI003609E823
MLPELRDLFVRDLEKLTLELEAYPDEASVWAVPDGVLNSGGTLALHLIGNLSQFVGADLGGVPFVRDRAAEFARRDVPRAELIAGVRGCRRWWRVRWTGWPRPRWTRRTRRNCRASRRA